MKLSLPLIASAAILFGVSAAQAVDSPGASKYSPGHKMQDSDAQKSSELDRPGASEYAPGQQKQSEDLDSPGASEYAPGQQDNPSAAGKTMDSDPKSE